MLLCSLTLATQTAIEQPDPRGIYVANVTPTDRMPETIMTEHSTVAVGVADAPGMAGADFVWGMLIMGAVLLFVAVIVAEMKSQRRGKHLAE